MENKKTNSKNRKTFTTTIDKDILTRVQIAKTIMQANDIPVDGYNELIEEGITMVLDKYSEKYDLDL